MVRKIVVLNLLEGIVSHLKSVFELLKLLYPKDAINNPYLVYSYTPDH
jgi:hypothetical protein